MDKRYAILMLIIKVSEYLLPVIVGWITKLLIQHEANKSKQKKIEIVSNTILKYIALAEAIGKSAAEDVKNGKQPSKDEINKVKLNISVTGVLKEAVKNKGLTKGLKKIGINLAEESGKEALKSLIEIYLHTGKLGLPKFTPNFKF